MYSMLKTELGELYAFIKRNWNEIAVISLSTLFLVMARYNAIGPRWQNPAFYYGVLPLLSIVFVLRRNPLDFGLRLGNVKVWAFHLLVSCPLIFLLIYLGTRTAAVQHYYNARSHDLTQILLNALLVLLPWEFIFRGFMLFGLKDRLKEASILVQMIPFTLLHAGKPELETISCIISGIYFGYICYRGNSYWPAFFIHYFINVTTKLLAVAI